MTRGTALLLVVCFGAILVGVAVYDLSAGLTDDLLDGVDVSVETVRDGRLTRAIDERVSDRSALTRRVRPYWNELVLRGFEEVAGRVVVGRDGWLFYEASLGPFQEPLASESFRSMIADIEQLHRGVTVTGAGFLVLVIPAKFRVYRHKLHRPIVPEERRALLGRVYAELAARGIDAPDLLAPLLAERERRAELLYPPNDSHLSQAGFGWLVTDVVAPVLGIAREEARRRLVLAPSSAEELPYRGDLIDLSQLPDSGDVARRFAFHERRFEPPPCADAPAPILVLGDSFSIHYDRLFPRLVQAIGQRPVDARFAHGGHVGRLDEIMAEYRGRRPDLVILIVTERSFASEI